MALKTSKGIIRVEKEQWMGSGDDERKNCGKGSCRRKNEETRLKKGEKSEENLSRRN